MTTLTVDARDVVELTEILEYLIGSLTTLVAPATIAPSVNGDAYDLDDLRADITRLVDRLGATPPSSRRGTNSADLIAVNRGDIDDIAHILSQLEDVLLHSDDDTLRDLTGPLNNTCTQSLAQWIRELASYLHRLLAHN